MAYLKQNPDHPTTARKMILSPTDSPQLGTLPDITFILRHMLIQTDLDQCGFIMTPLYAALPCIRRQMSRCKSSSTPEPDTHQVAICILLGLLLGLYPSSVKFPPFQVSVSLYRRIHCLLTNGGGINFCLTHPALLTLALMEYTAYVIPAYLPVEYSLIVDEYGMQSFFSSCALICDTFRQEALETGEESWDMLEAYCTPIVERHTRACKSRQRARQHEQFPVVKLPLASTDCLPEIPYIIPYSIHLEDPTNCIMASEMAFLGLLDEHTPIRSNLTAKQEIQPHETPIESQQSNISQPSQQVQQIQHSGLNSTTTEHHSKTEHTKTSKNVSKNHKATKNNASEDSLRYEDAVAMQRTLHIHQLPPNLTKLQLSALSARMRICERSALSGSIIYVCIACVMANQQTICRKGKAFPTRGQCKLDLDTNSLLCSVCQSNSIISVNTFGRIVSLRNHRFYLTPCCCTVQIYTGRGDEFQITPETCPHKQTKISTKMLKKRCELCSNIALPEPHASVDHLTGEQHYTNLCQRHTPHPDSLKHVTNWRQLQDEIRRRDKPLFSLRSHT
jgi:hypothetical protein